MFSKLIFQNLGRNILQNCAFLQIRTFSTHKIKIMTEERCTSSKKRKIISKGTKQLTVLVDMDGVLCDFETHALELFRQKYPDEPYVPLENRRKMNCNEEYEDLKPGLGAKMFELFEAPYFFLNLAARPGAVKAITEMSTIPGVQVFICTSTILTSKYCAQEKYEWVRKYLGQDWIKKTILTSDKTVARGDLLIDDRYNIKGALIPPTWKHVLFTDCHNKHLDYHTLDNCIRRQENWTDGSWRTFLEDYKKNL